MPTRDLSHPLGPDAPVYPGDPPVMLAPHATMSDDGFRVTAVTLGSHAGTHVDAPAHVLPEGATVDELPVEAFVFDAVRVAVDRGPREAIPPSDLDGVDADADLVVVDTGWADRWGTDAYRDHPYLAPATARWCADRGLSVGLDTYGPDPTPPADAEDADLEGLPAHVALLGAGCLLVEHLRHLERLPERFVLRALPLALVGADAAPARVVAEW